MRWFRRILYICLATPVLLVALLLLWLQTDFGRRQFVDLIAWSTRGSSTEIRIGALDGAFPVDITLHELHIADSQGDWLSGDNIHLTWSPLALFARQAKIDILHADSLTVLRLPASTAPAPASKPAGNFTVPQLPISLDLQSLSVDRLGLPAAVAGSAMTLSLDARARAARRGDLDARLTAHRLDAPATPDDVTAAIGYQQATDHLSIDLRIDEPQGGLLTQMIGLPGKPHLSIVAAGDAPLSRWTGTLSARLDEAALLDMTATIGGSATARQFDISLTADPGPLLPKKLRSLIAGGLRLDSTGAVLNDQAATRIQLDHLHLASTALDLNAQGRIDPAGDSDLHLQASLSFINAFAALLPQLTWKNAKIDADISGHTTLPALKLAGDIDGLQYGDNKIGQMTFNLTGQPGSSSTAPIALALTAVASGVEPATPNLRSLATGDIKLNLAGSVDRAGNIAATSLALTSGIATMTGQAQATMWGETAQATLSLSAPDLRVFRDLAKLPLQGHAQLDMQASKSATGAMLNLDATTGDFAAGQSQIDNLLGPAPQLVVQAEQAANGQIDIKQADLTGQAIKIGATGHAGADELALAITGNMPNLAAIDRQLSGDLGWKINIAGTPDKPTLDGQLNAGKLTAANIAARDLALQLRIADLKTLAGIDTAGKATVNGLPAELKATASLLSAGDKTTIKLDRLDSHIGRTTLSAQAQIMGNLATGTATLASPDIAELKPLLQADAKGSLNLNATFTTTGGRQNIDATLTGKGLGYGDTAEISQLQVTTKILDAFNTASQQSRIDLTNAVIAQEKLTEAHATFAGPINHLAFDLAGKGPRLDFGLAGNFARQQATDTLTLERAKVTAFGQQISLLHAASVTHAATSTQIDNLVLVNGKGQISLAGKLTPDSNQVDLAVRHLPLAVLAAVAPALHVDGEINGTLRLTGSKRNPQADLALSLDQVSSSDLSIPPMSARLTAGWQNGRVDAQGDIKLAAQDQPLHVTAAAPLAVDPSTGFPRPDMAAEIAATAKGRIDLAMANGLLLDSVSRVGGQADIDLQIAGPMAKPRIGGHVMVVNGSYGNLRTGTRLREIQAIVLADGLRFELQHLDAKTPGNGAVSGSGYVDLSGERDVAIHITARNAQLLDSSMMSAAADADLSIAAKGAEAMQMTGTIKVDKAEIRIPDSLAASVQEIAVTERNVEAKTAVSSTQPAGPPADQASAGPPMRIALDLTIDAPQQVAIRGRGLDAELGGKLHVGGEASQPLITGQLKLRHGTFDLVGRNLAFDRGIISFYGGTPIDPQLDFAAKAKAESYDITVTVSGTATKPKLALTSTPTLPQDEALARLLFGRPAGSLSPLQAIQLAQATATLAGISTGPSILDKVRSATGLDRLNVDAGDDAGSKTAATGPSLNAGRYVAPGVYLGVKQGTKAGSSAATVEIDVTPHVKVETDIGANDNSGAGVNMQWDY